MEFKDMTVIETENLTKVYRTPFARRRVKAVQGLNLEVRKGEIFGFLGPNGAGKTTTLKILTGLLYPTSGKAWIFGKDVTHMDSKGRTGFLPEHPFFYPHLTGYELLDLCGQLFRIEGAERKRRIDRLLLQLGLEDSARLQLSKYSKGMVQRIGIAQALINEPDLVILDEPLAGLDPLGRKDLKEIMLRLREEGRTVFFSTHILPDVELICDRVGILIQGKLVSTGRLDELLEEEVESVDITAKGLSQKAVDSIGQTCQRVVRSGEKVQFTVTNEEEADKVESLIRKHSGRVVSLIPRTKSLEEHFVAQVAGEV